MARLRLSFSLEAYYPLCRYLLASSLDPRQCPISHGDLEFKVRPYSSLASWVADLRYNMGGGRNKVAEGDGRLHGQVTGSGRLREG